MTPGDETRGTTGDDEGGGTATQHAARARDADDAIPRAGRSGGDPDHSFADATGHRK